jgi:hypothetical protein
MPGVHQQCRGRKASIAHGGVTEPQPRFSWLPARAPPFRSSFSRLGRAGRAHGTRVEPSRMQGRDIAAGFGAGVLGRGWRCPVCIEGGSSWSAHIVSRNGRVEGDLTGRILTQTEIGRRRASATTAVETVRRANRATVRLIAKRRCPRPANRRSPAMNALRPRSCSRNSTRRGRCGGAARRGVSSRRESSSFARPLALGRRNGRSVGLRPA